VKRIIVATTILLAVAAAARAGDHAANRTAARDACIVEILYSEELPGAPIFQNLVRARLRITPPDRPAFETTVERLMPWQMPPPRRGQRLALACDRAVVNDFSFAFPFR
jgi:hypothetical protein